MGGGWGWGWGGWGGYFCWGVSTPLHAMEIAFHMQTQELNTTIISQRSVDTTGKLQPIGKRTCQMIFTHH